jgi:hypothetical protein
VVEHGELGQGSGVIRWRQIDEWTPGKEKARLEGAGLFDFIGEMWLVNQAIMRCRGKGRTLPEFSTLPGI